MMEREERKKMKLSIDDDVVFLEHDYSESGHLNYEQTKAFLREALSAVVLTKVQLKLEEEDLKAMFDEVN